VSLKSGFFFKKIKFRLGVFSFFVKKTTTLVFLKPVSTALSVNLAPGSVQSHLIDGSGSVTLSKLLIL